MKKFVAFALLMSLGFVFSGCEKKKEAAPVEGTTPAPVETPAEPAK